MATKRHRALVLVCIQYDFLMDGDKVGSLAVPDGNAVIPIINQIRKKFKTVIHTADWHPADHCSFSDNNPGTVPFELIMLPYGPQVMWPTHCVQNTRGAEFHHDMVYPPTDIVVKCGQNSTVDSYSGFWDNGKLTKSSLQDELTKFGITDVYICGLATDYCVSWSCLDAVQLGFNTYFIEDASRGIAENSTAVAMARMKDCGVHLINSSEIEEKDY
jgi:nicotinamidase/pyrazinamidase